MTINQIFVLPILYESVCVEKKEVAKFKVKNTTSKMLPKTIRGSPLRKHKPSLSHHSLSG